MQASDFECIQSWPKVRNFRITNKLGREPAAVARASAGGSGDYPVGTVVQIVPIEAMVKRAPGFSPQSNDWEFFLLDVTASGTGSVSHHASIHAPTPSTSRWSGPSASEASRRMKA